MSKRGERDDTRVRHRTQRRSRRCLRVVSDRARSCRPLARNAPEDGAAFLGDFPAGNPRLAAEVGLALNRWKEIAEALQRIGGVKARPNILAVEAEPELAVPVGLLEKVDFVYGELVDPPCRQPRKAARLARRLPGLGLDTHVERRIQIERDLRRAIACDLIVPHYQPLVSLDGNCIIGFEALARWESEGLGYIPPDVFIPIAEETGLINVLGDQLLRRACLDAKAWPASFVLAFNVSPIQMRDPMLGPRILAILGQTGFSPRRLEIEITESALVQNIGVAQTVIDDLRKAGVRIALDDFGTGYATLTQLLSFHLDKIKIDQRFVSRLDRSDDALVIVRAILGLAKGFGLTTTAEGVEDAGQLACLKANGCTEGQGYLFGKAVPAAEIPALLSHTSLDAAA
jgi:EAL domain-containing protein (putative c-di-GMP-specific phosphodiesterase class I)